ncbi:MAG: hypothetical protein AB4372_16895 [Xenococcus sp. (in: cyanobacteria)]
MDKNYIKKQAKRAKATNSTAAKDDCLWRIASNCDFEQYEGFGDDGSLSPELKQKAQAIADEVLTDD